MAKIKGRHISDIARERKEALRGKPGGPSKHRPVDLPPEIKKRLQALKEKAERGKRQRNTV